MILTEPQHVAYKDHTYTQLQIFLYTTKKIGEAWVIGNKLRFNMYRLPFNLFPIKIKNYIFYYKIKIKNNIIQENPLVSTICQLANHVSLEEVNWESKV